MNYEEHIDYIDIRARRIFELFDADEQNVSVENAAKILLVSLGTVMERAIEEDDAETLGLIAHACGELHRMLNEAVTHVSVH